MLMRIVLTRRVVLLLAGGVVAGTLLALATATSEAQEPDQAVATLVDGSGAEAGEVSFVDLDGGRTLVYAEVGGLPSGFHGFHLHETGSCEPDFGDAGGHHNPGGDDHGAHAGDMPVLLADEGGDAVGGFVTDRVSVDELLADDGTAVIVHENPDNYANIPDRYQSDDADAPGPDDTTLAVGDAGGRLRCGVVEDGEGPSAPERRFSRVARAPIAGPDGLAGSATFGELEDGRVVVTAEVEGLPGGGFHGFHLHETGSCEPDFGDAGGHHNPGGDDHGAHAGDMPVLLADDGGDARATFVTDRVSVDELLADDGTAVIVHENADNYANIPDRYQSSSDDLPEGYDGGPDNTTLAVGDAGGRLGCGVIEQPLAASAELVSPDGEAMGEVTFVDLQAFDQAFDFEQIEENVGGADLQGRGVTAQVEETAEGTLVLGKVDGLPGGGFHGFHLHETGSCEPDFGAAGGHFDPGGDDHGGHAGDMPVLLAADDGEAATGFITDRVSVGDLLASPDGTAVIVHEAPDNYANIPDRYQSDDADAPGPDDTTLAVGDAGGRLACGEIAAGPGGQLDGEPGTIGGAARAVVEGPDGVTGEAFFAEQEDGKVAVLAEVGGLPGGGFHGFHLHQTGSCEPDFGAAGGHHNPGGESHGAHAGDMPVLLATDEGTAFGHFVTDRVSVDELLADDGAAVIVHENADNYANIPDRYQSSSDDVPEGYDGGPDNTTLAVGDAGGRLGCGVVESFVGLERFAGADRIETAIAVSRALYPAPGSAGAVVLARADDFADALAGTPLATAAEAPTLLTGSDELTASTRAEIDRALGGDGTVHVLGGPAAVSDGVTGALEAAGYTVNRIAGADRFETSAAIAGALDHPGSVLLARGGEFPDAVTAGAAAAHTDAAVLLTTGDEPHPAASAYLDQHQPDQTFAVGGPAVSAHPDATAVSGPHRWATAREVAEEFFTDPFVVGIARSDAFPDALTGGVLAGGSGGPMLLTQPAALHEDTEAYLCAANASSLSLAAVFGGPAAISQDVADTVGLRVDGQGC